MTNYSLSVYTPLLPAGNLEAYIHQVNQIPMLTEAEELELAERLKDRDLQAAQRMVLAHLRYVVSVARSYLGYGLAFADLIQEGTVGLMKAVKRFEPNKGVRLVSFAIHWIKAEIHEFIIKNWRIVKIATTKAQRKLFFKLRSSKKQLGWFTQAERKMIAHDLGVKISDVELMEQRLHANDASFDLPVEENEPQSNGLPLYTPSQYLEADNANPAEILEVKDWRSQLGDKLRNALQRLDIRRQEIIRKRWLTEGSKATLQELSDLYKISPERVRQLELSAIKELYSMISS